MTKSDGKQSLIFDGRPVNLVLEEPATTLLPNFSLLNDWQVAENENIRFGKVDIDNCYHRIGVQIGVSAWLQPFLGLPPVTA